MSFPTEMEMKLWEREVTEDEYTQNKLAWEAVVEALAKRGIVNANWVPQPPHLHYP